MRTFYKHPTRSGASLVETLVTMSITAFAMGAIYVGSITLQKSFRAAQHYSNSQAAQLRIIDYIALDLRRATGWPQVSAKEIQLTLPNYYDQSDPPKPRDPKVGSNGEVYYGTSPQDKVQVRYYTTESGAHRGGQLIDIHRSVTVDGVTTDSVIVRGADNFEITFDPSDPKEQVVRTKITFPPNFRPFADSGDVYRDGTALYSSTLVRNKR